MDTTSTDASSNQKAARLNEVIRDLQAAPSGSRSLDGQIAYLLGWERRAFPYSDKQSGDTRERLFWVNPGTADPDKVPSYTTNLQSGYELAKQISPDLVCAVSWGDGGGKVSVLHGERQVDISAPTAPLALCIAILTICAPT